MAYKQLKNIGLSVILFAGFSSCEKVDMRNMFISYDDANQRFEQSMEWNATHPFREIVVGTDNYTIFTMGDSHVGETKNLDTFIQAAIDSNVAAAVMVGDLTIGRADDYDVFVQHLPNPSPIPIIPIVGNHDLYFDGWKEYYSRFGSSTFYFTIRTPEAADLFICLDSGGGTLGDKQLEWLKTVFNDIRPNYRRCFILTHDNLLQLRSALSTTPLVEEVYVLMDLFMENRVDLVINAHDHKRNVDVLGNTTYIIMDALVDSFAGASYLKINVQGGTISYSFVDVE